MLALSFGLTAALIWATHDLLVRKLSQRLAIVPLILLVLVTGAFVLAVPAAVMGDWATVGGTALWLCGFGGLGYAIAIGALYRAFNLAPVRIVSPIIGSYPVMTLAIAVAQGRTVTGADWLAVALIVPGIAIVAMSGDEAGRSVRAQGHLPAMGWSALSAASFAAAFALAQEAARQSSDLPAILMMRLVAVACIALLYLWLRKPATAGPAPWRGQWRIILLMGVFDGLALALVTASGNLPRAEYASVTAALFGVVTVLLAAWFLRERVRPVQWMGIALVFSGVGLLSLQG
ncbi:MAG: EamA family transporter [Pseudorhodobacter sp.]